MGRVSVLPHLLILAVATTGSAAYADGPACTAVLTDDAELMKSIPERLRPIVETARFHAMLANRQAAWAGFESALDRALANEGKRVVGKIDGLSTLMYFKRNRKGDLELWLGALAKDQVSLRGASPSGLRFLDFVAAELDWIAKARASGKITNLSIIGKDVENERLADTLVTLGFKPARFPGPRCYLFGVVGGLSGYGAGRLFFTQFDNDVENGSIYDEQRRFYRDVGAGALLGTGSAVALACFRKTGRNYSVEFRPGEIVKNPADRAAGEIPPIDEKPPIPDPDPVPVDPIDNPPFQFIKEPNFGDAVSPGAKAD